MPEVDKAIARGKYEWIIARTTAALAPYPYLEGLWYWRGKAEKALGDDVSARTAFLRALEVRPGWDLAINEMKEFEQEEKP